MTHFHDIQMRPAVRWLEFFLFFLFFFGHRESFEARLCFQSEMARICFTQSRYKRLYDQCRFPHLPYWLRSRNGAITIIIIVVVAAAAVVSYH